MLVYFYDVNPCIVKKDISQYFICALLLPFRLYALLRNANSRRRRLTGHTAHFPHCSSLSNVTEIHKHRNIGIQNYWTQNIMYFFSVKCVISHFMWKVTKVRKHEKSPKQSFLIRTILLDIYRVLHLQSTKLCVYFFTQKGTKTFYDCKVVVLLFKNRICLPSLCNCLFWVHNETTILCITVFPFVFLCTQLSKTVCFVF